MIVAAAPTFQHAPERKRYEVLVDDEVVGVCTYHDAGGSRVLVHTKIAGGWEGYGLGSSLIEFALDDIRRSGLHLVPRCPMVAAFVNKHPEWADLVGEPGR